MLLPSKPGTLTNSASIWVPKRIKPEKLLKKSKNPDLPSRGKKKEKPPLKSMRKSLNNSLNQDSLLASLQDLDNQEELMAIF
jgi:hypothetical protein